MPLNLDTCRLAKKVSQVKQRFSNLKLPELEIFPSQDAYYRMRAEFRLWHEGNQCYYAMFTGKDKKAPVKIEDFPIASKTINKLMPKLLAELHLSETLKRKLFQVEFLTSQTGDALISLIYHKKLDEIWLDQAKALANRLNAHIVGRARKQKYVIGQDYIIEQLQVANRTWYYQQIENTFSQPNASINEKMLQWVNSLTKNSRHDLLELYCGNGNFTCVLASNFCRVLATEISNVSIRSAENNLKRNQITNVTLLRMSSEEMAQAFDNVRPFRRLQEKSIHLDQFNFQTLLVDPPRSGLDNNTLEIAQRFNRIIYISCNPTTLLENTQQLAKSHDITHFAIFDQFKDSPHIECGMLFTKK